MPREREEYFTISAVATRFDVHPQTLRIYERQGLLAPQRSRGNTRRYSRADIERLRLILNLTRDLGVNLAGVEVIIHLKDQIQDLEREMERMLRHFFEEGMSGKASAGLVRVGAGKPWKRK